MYLLLYKVIICQSAPKLANLVCCGTLSLSLRNPTIYARTHDTSQWEQSRPHVNKRLWEPIIGTYHFTLEINFNVIVKNRSTISKQPRRRHREFWSFLAPRRRSVVWQQSSRTEFSAGFSHVIHDLSQHDRIGEMAQWKWIFSLHPLRKRCAAGGEKIDLLGNIFRKCGFCFHKF